jgi:uncharacterized cupin superfamily protein
MTPPELNTTAAARLVVGDALAVDLAEEIPPGTGVVAGDPVAHTTECGRFGDVEFGLWQLTPGAVRDIEADELFVVLAGRGSIRFADGSLLALGPGTLVRLEAGDATEWTIVETLRKVYLTLAD